MFKAIKRIRKDRVKFVVDFTALSITLTTPEDIQLRLQVQRGDQKPEDLPVMRVRAGRKQTLQYPRNMTPFECSYFIKDGVPDPKVAKITAFVVNDNGRGAVAVASVEVNFSNHFGAQFEEDSQKLSPTAAAQARGILCESVRFRAHITAKKDKYAE